MDGSRLPQPASIRAQMPRFAAYLEKLGAVLEPERLQAMLRTSVALRRAVDADDYEQVNALFRMYVGPHGRMYWREGGFEFGVGDAELKSFAERHRAARRRERGEE